MLLEGLKEFCPCHTDTVPHVSASPVVAQGQPARLKSSSVSVWDWALTPWEPAQVSAPT